MRYPDSFVRFVHDRLFEILIVRLEDVDRELAMRIEFLSFLLLNPQKVPEEDEQMQILGALRQIDHHGEF